MPETTQKERTTDAPVTDSGSSDTDKNGQAGAQADGKADAPPPAAPPTPAQKTRGLILRVVAVVAIIFALIYGVKWWSFNRVHVSTDDAYVTGDLVNVSPLVSGTLQKLTVSEGDFVKRGDLLARLDPSGPIASLNQAKANYQAAISQIPQAERSLALQKSQTDAEIQKALAALQSQRSKAAGAGQQVTLTQSTVSNQVDQARAQVDAAKAQTRQAVAQIGSAIANRDNLVQAVQTALHAESNYQQQVTTAQHAADAARARAAGSQAVAERASRDEVRFRTLYQQDAVSAQAYDSAHAQAVNAQNQYQAALLDSQQADSQVASAKDAAFQARSQVEQARKAVAQAQAQVKAYQEAAAAASEQVAVSQAGLKLAQANRLQVGVEQSASSSATSQTGESEADVATANADKNQIDIRRKQIDIVRAQANQAKAALTNAEILLSDTYVYAPSDGEVVRKDSNEGATMSPGSTIVTITKGSYVWVVANFKETQLQDVRVGEPAEISVDAFPGKTFKARVQSIISATGAATALLPPDNATGNFTKVVQRIPVRIELVPADAKDDKSIASADDIKNLRQGMSVTATIDTADKDKYPAGEAGPQSTGGGQGFDRTPGSASDSGQPTGSASNTTPAPGSTTDSGFGSAPGPVGANSHSNPSNPSNPMQPSGDAPSQSGQIPVPSNSNPGSSNTMQSSQSASPAVGSTQSNAPSSGSNSSTGGYSSTPGATGSSAGSAGPSGAATGGATSSGSASGGSAGGGH